MKKVIVETCPHCMHENTYIHSEKTINFVEKCKNCKSEIMLCSECKNDNCNWHSKSSENEIIYGICIMGVTINVRK